MGFDKFTLKNNFQKVAYILVNALKYRLFITSSKKKEPHLIDVIPSSLDFFILFLTYPIDTSYILRICTDIVDIQPADMLSSFLRIQYLYMP